MRWGVSTRFTFLIPPGGRIRPPGVIYFTDQSGEMMRTTKFCGWVGVLLMAAVVAACDSGSGQQTPGPESQLPDVMKPGHAPKMPGPPGKKAG